MRRGASPSVNRAAGQSPATIATLRAAAEPGDLSASSVTRSAASPGRLRFAREPAGELPFVARLARAPAAWLVAVVGASTIIRAAIGFGVPSPWILPDEVVYSDLAASIGHGGRPTVRGVPELGWGVVYPALIAPAWRVFPNAYWAYHATLTANALVMSLAAVPAYLLARTFVSKRTSLVVALMAVLVPSMSYTGAVMTENATYPIFLFAVLAITRTVRRPTLGNQALALLALGILALTRIQGSALVVAYVTAVLLYAWTSPFATRGYLRHFLPTVAVALPVALAPMAVSLARGDGALGWLGARSGTFEDLALGEVPQWVVFLFSGLVLYVAVIPIAATAVLVRLGLSRAATERVRLFAAVVLPTWAAMLVSVAFVSASFDVDGIGNLNERYVFYVVPLAFVGLGLWIEAGLLRPRRGTWAVVAACCLLTALLPIDRLDYNAGLQALALVPWGALPVPEGVVALLVAMFTLACGAIWATCTPRTVGRLWLVIGVVMVAVGVAVVSSNASSSSRLAQSFEGRSATWVDDVVEPGGRVVGVWDERNGKRGFYFWLMITELFNRSVGDVYRIGPRTTFEDFLPTRHVEVGPDGTLRDGRGRSVEAEYALVPCSSDVDGLVVGRSARDALRLVKVDGPLRVSRVAGCTRAAP